MPDINDIIDYENGEMDEERLIAFFQGLVDSGMAWKLQGFYGSMAKQLIEEGLVFLPEKKVQK